jgi:glycosyltransferase involved in cell wall biosynthesis
MPENRSVPEKSMALADTTAAHRPKVLLLIPHLRGGGAEQVTRLLARGLSAEKYEVHVGLVTEPFVRSGVFPEHVQVTALGAGRVRASALKLLRLVWQVRPAVILSGMAHLNFLVLMLRPLFPSGTWVLVRQNATISLTLASAVLPVYTRALYRMLYRQADRVICQSSAMARDLTYATGTRADRIAVLPNPVDSEGIREGRVRAIRWAGPGPHLLAVGRLSPEKGFDLLVRAVSIVRDYFPDASLTIAGAGPEQEALQEDCVRLGLEKAVSFAGYLDSPYPLFPGADLFVLSSRYEGMPNALVEAAAAGLPIVAFPASGGVVDFLGSRPQTWIAERISAQALATCMVEALLALRHQKQCRGGVAPVPRAVSPIASISAL